MTRNPINLLVAFLLELVSLYAVGYWGWQVGGDGFLKFVLAIGLPILVAVIWGVFGAKEDLYRGTGPIPVSGKVRLAIEIGVFAFATLAFYAAGATLAAIIFGVVALVQRVASYDRVIWLVRH